MIDNYDSFTFNLVQYLLQLGVVVDVHRNDAVTLEQVLADAPSHIMLSPGPGTPSDSGVCQDLCRRLAEADAPAIPLLGVCLGHQTLCEVLGARVERAGRIMHGKLSPMVHDNTGVFAGLPSPFMATRYHSLAAVESTLPAALVPNARTDVGELMGVRHATRPLHGVQFHPESVLSEHGHAMLRTFLEMHVPSNMAGAT
ncbi:anthranilate synthase component II [Nannocystis pusilla]|uniref:Aminodeoxychorismate/anthranilate synthase component II n=1 Tax=Nannocystis pusilla TaxID=889268 RepID=A0ABS7U0W1_9BACT|nr:aminodeoxychorismate/anthranilate synthase component II [Nannocystis pusilla]